MNPVHVDPFAPADHPDHPANAGRAPVQLSGLEPPALRWSPDEFDTLLSEFPDDVDPELGHSATTEEAVQELVDERSALLGVYGTADEVAAATGETPVYPSIDELRGRARDHLAELVAARPTKDAPKAEWVAYYRLVFSGSTEEEAKALTIPELKDQTRLEGLAETDSVEQ